MNEKEESNENFHERALRFADSSLLIDKEILESTYIGCHPCVNTCSLKIRLEDILKILLPKISHQNFNIVEL